MIDGPIVLILLSLFFSNTIYGLASPFLPKIIEAKEIASVWTGVIFAIFAVASIISSLLVGKILDQVGHNRVIMIGSFIMSTCIACFGLVDGIEQSQYVIIVSIVLRIG